VSRFDLAEAWRAAPAAGHQIATAVLEVHVQSAERNENNVLQVRRPTLALPAPQRSAVCGLQYVQYCRTAGRHLCRCCMFGDPLRSNVKSHHASWRLHVWTRLCDLR